MNETAATARGRGRGSPLLLALALLCWANQPAAADDRERPAPPGDGAIALPQPLGAADLARYQDIFALQADGRWRAADRRIAALESDLLLGHVLFQRYMHPTDYRSRYAELRDWLAAYRDHPGAWRVYRLAMRRRGSAAAPPRPDRLRTLAAATESTKRAVPPPPRRSAAERREVAEFQSRLGHELQRGRPDRAEKRYWAIARRDLLSPAETAEALGRVAQGYFRTGNDGKALALARIATATAPAAAATAHWAGGLAAWRRGEAEAAYALFSRLAEPSGRDAPENAAAGVWAARAALATGRPEAIVPNLLRAAAQPESFYGLIALRQLGLTMRFDWRAPLLNRAQIAELEGRPAVRRAIALTAIGEDARADAELRRLLGRLPPEERSALAALAARLELPASQLHAAIALGPGRMPPAVRYPVPRWQPEGGFRIDRAVIFAIMRQESKFLARARSHAGARGLMQLMPATASYVTGDPSLRWRESRLYEPGFNMALGQRYIAELAGLGHIRGNLFRLAAAYNAGPGNLARWLRRGGADEDALLFVESIPLGETRAFVKQVMANLWLYRLQLDQPAPSLDAVAAGEWPRYRSLDKPDERRLARTAPASDSREMVADDED